MAPERQAGILRGDPATWGRPAPRLSDLRAVLEQAEERAALELAQLLYVYTEGMYADVFDRPSNVDNPVMLQAILATLNRISYDLPLTFPAHPRTCQRMAENNLGDVTTHLRLIEPFGYLDFMALQQQATLVITD